MQKILKEVLLGPMCQVLQVAFGDLRLSWVQPQIQSDQFCRSGLFDQPIKLPQIFPVT